MVFRTRSHQVCRVQRQSEKAHRDMTDLRDLCTQSCDVVDWFDVSVQTWMECCEQAKKVPEHGTLLSSSSHTPGGKTAATPRTRTIRDPILNGEKELEGEESGMCRSAAGSLFHHTMD